MGFVLAIFKHLWGFNFSMKKLIILSTIILFNLSINAETLKDFTLPIYSKNKQFNLRQELSKKKVVINFWASWCTACIRELKELEQLKLNNKNITFIAVNAGESTKKIKRFLKKYHFSYLILEDKDRIFSKSIGISSLPQTMVIDQKSNILYRSDTPPKKI